MKIGTQYVELGARRRPEGPEFRAWVFVRGYRHTMQLGLTRDWRLRWHHDRHAPPRWAT